MRKFFPSRNSAIPIPRELSAADDAGHPATRVVDEHAATAREVDPRDGGGPRDRSTRCTAAARATAPHATPHRRGPPLLHTPPLGRGVGGSVSPSLAKPREDGERERRQGM
nr:unnamed protein product [Digitaria exilis]